MKKHIKRRRLLLNIETLQVFRVLSPNDLHENQVIGASEPNCPPTGGPTGPASQTH
jgi:hypothetical protein